MVKLFQLSKRYFLVVIASVCCTLSLVGCDEPAEPTGTVAGTVISDGVPVSDCRVLAHHVESTLSIVSRVGDDGRYAFNDVPLGNYRFAVQQKPSLYAAKDPFDERIPKKFRRVKTSGFEISLEEGNSELDLEMKR